MGNVEVRKNEEGYELNLNAKKNDVMKSTFSIVFYLKRQVVKKDGTVPVMGRITVAGMKSLSTYTKYSIGCAYVGEFLQEHYHVKDIALQELSLSFITDYETFLRTDKRLKIKKSE